MDKLNAMKTFMRVAELGSLSAAARDLRLTQPAVSQQIAGLEQQLGAQLLFRSTRAVTLTEAGNDYYQRLKPIMAAVDEAEEALHGQHHQLQGNLRLHAPTGFGQRHITPLAIAFQKRHPDLTIELLLDDRRADVIGEGIDVALRFADLIDRTFGPDAAAGERPGACGHPEIETALVQLADHTGERRWLDLAAYFLDARGRGLLHQGRARRVDLGRVHDQRPGDPGPLFFPAANNRAYQRVVTDHRATRRPAPPAAPAIAGAARFCYTPRSRPAGR